MDLCKVNKQKLLYLLVACFFATAPGAVTASHPSQPSARTYNTLPSTARIPLTREQLSALKVNLAYRIDLVMKENRDCQENPSYNAAEKETMRDYYKKQIESIMSEAKETPDCIKIVHKCARILGSM